MQQCVECAFHYTKCKFLVEMTFPMTANVKCAIKRILLQNPRCLVPIGTGWLSFSCVRAEVEEVQKSFDLTKFGLILQQFAKKDSTFLINKSLAR